jgi:hypothetical protein
VATGAEQGPGTEFLKKKRRTVITCGPRRRRVLEGLWGPAPLDSPGSRKQIWAKRYHISKRESSTKQQSAPCPSLDPLFTSRRPESCRRAMTTSDRHKQPHQRTATARRDENEQGPEQKEDVALTEHPPRTVAHMDEQNIRCKLSHTHTHTIFSSQHTPAQTRM